MAMVMQVGEKKDMKPVPKDFPKCGNYMPEPLLDENYNIRETTDSSSTKNTPIAFLIVTVGLILIFTSIF